MAEQHFADVGKLVEALVQKHQAEADDLALSEKVKYGDSSTVSTYTWVHSLKAAHQKFVRDLMDIQTALDSAPTLSPDDVRGVGEWIAERDGSIVKLSKNGFVGDSCHCSVCNEHLDGSEEYAVKGIFCPSCGAIMNR